MDKYTIERSGTRSKDAWYSRTALPIEGGFIGKFRIKSRYGTTIASGRSYSLNLSSAITELKENAKIQAVFKHLNDVDNRKDSENLGWRRFYGDSDDAIEDTKDVKKKQNFSDDVGDDIEVKLIDYIFEYPKFESTTKYKTINFKGKRYVQTFEKRKNRYVFSERYALKGRTSRTRRMLE